jgi:hypothetical protein
MEWLQNNAGLVIEIGLTLFIIGSWIWDKFNKAYKIKKGRDEFYEKVERHEKELKEVNASLEKVFIILKEQDEQSKKNNCAILRNMIIDKYKQCKEIHDTTGCISALDYENLKEMFDRYFVSGGNHLISKIYDDFKKWEVSLDEFEL